MFQNAERSWFFSHWVTKAHNPLLDELWILFTCAQGEIMKKKFMAEY